MIQIIRNSKYNGPIGILDHRSDTDTETALRENLAGMRKLLGQIGANEALKSYSK